MLNKPSLPLPLSLRLLYCHHYRSLYCTATTITASTLLPPLSLPLLYCHHYHCLYCTATTVSANAAVTHNASPAATATALPPPLHLLPTLPQMPPFVSSASAFCCNHCLCHCPLPLSLPSSSATANWHCLCCCLPVHYICCHHSLRTPYIAPLYVMY